MSQEKSYFESGKEYLSNALVSAQEKAHELGARMGLVTPTMQEEIKFGAEKMKTTDTQGNINETKEQLKENLYDTTENAYEKGKQAWNGTQNTLHEHGARMGVVEPTMAEEIKFGAEKMGTADTKGRLGEVEEKIKEGKENLQEKGTQVWEATQDKAQEMNEKMKANLEKGREKVKEATEAPGQLHEIGARVGLANPTMAEEIKFGAEKMGTAGPTVGVKEKLDSGAEKLKGAKENIQEKGSQAWTGTKEKLHEHGARLGVVEPTMAEEIKFGAEKMGTADTREATV